MDGYRRGKERKRPPLLISTRRTHIYQPSFILLSFSPTNVPFSLASTTAIILAALTNYVVKKENDSGEALRGLGKTVVESYNFLTKINAKYDISDKVS